MDTIISSGNQLLDSTFLQINTPPGLVIKLDKKKKRDKDEKNKQLSAKSHKANKNQLAIM